MSDENKPRDFYTPEEITKKIANQEIDPKYINDFQRGKQNFLSYNGLLYVIRTDRERICPHCQGKIPESEKYWGILGEGVEKKEGGNS